MRGRRARAAWVAALLCVAATGARAEDTRYRPVTTVTVVEKGPRIDGVLDEEAWLLAEPIQELIQVEPVEGARPSYPTDIRIVRTADALYFGVRAYDPHPNQIVAQKMERDTSLLSEDRITIALDTFRDGRSGFMFQINPLGTRTDSLIRYDQVIRDWDAIWNASARITSEGWVLEVELPFKSLNFDPDADGWGMNILRAIRRNNELLRWANASVDQSFINLSDAGILKGMEGARLGIGLDVVPAGTARRVDDEVTGEHEFGFRPSADVFYKPVPEMTASLTANTDFGETEVDTQQINLTRFALFFRRSATSSCRTRRSSSSGGSIRTPVPSSLAASVWWMERRCRSSSAAS